MTDDADARAVLADELLQQGDLRGELIQLQLALERIGGEPISERVRAIRRRRLEERVAELLDTLHETLYGELAPHVTRRSAPDLFDPAAEVVTWRAGRAECVWLQTTRRGFGLADAYGALTRCRLADGIRRLEVGNGYHEAFVLAAVADPLPALRALQLGSYRREIPSLPRVQLAHVGILRELVARLDELDVQYPLALAPLASPTLRRLRLIVSTTGQTFTAELPALEELIFLGSGLVPESLAAFPALRRLEMYNSAVPGWIARAFAADHAVATLVYTGRFTADDAAAVLAAGDRIAMTLRPWQAEDRAELERLRGRVPPCIVIP